MNKEQLRMLHDLLVGYELHSYGPPPASDHNAPGAKLARELQEMIEEEIEAKNKKT